MRSSALRGTLTEVKRWIEDAVLGFIAVRIDEIAARVNRLTTREYAPVLPSHLRY